MRSWLIDRERPTIPNKWSQSEVSQSNKQQHGVMVLCALVLLYMWMLASETHGTTNKRRKGLGAVVKSLIS